MGGKRRHSRSDKPRAPRADDKPDKPAYAGQSHGFTKKQEKNETVVMLGSMARLLGVLLDPTPTMAPMRLPRRERNNRKERRESVRYITRRLDEINDRLDEMGSHVFLGWDRRERDELIEERARLEAKL